MRVERINTMRRLAGELGRLMRGLEADLGNAWFRRQGRREKVSKIAHEIGEDLQALAEMIPPVMGAEEPHQRLEELSGPRGGSCLNVHNAAFPAAALGGQLGM